MKRRAAKALGLLLVAAALPGLAPPPQAKSAASNSAARYRTLEAAQTLVQMAEALDKNDCRRVLELGRPLTSHLDDLKTEPDLAETPVAVWAMLGHCSGQIGDWVQAAADVKQAIALAPGSQELRYAELETYRRGGNWSGLVEALERLSRDHPAMLNRLDMEFLYGLDSELQRTEHKPLQARLAALLASDSYKPEEFMAITDGFRLDHAVNLAAAGRREEARVLVASLGVPWTVARASVDARLRSFFPADPDLRRLAERMLARDQALMKQHPDRLEPVIAVATELEMLGRPQEALAVLQSVAGRVDDPKAFVDRDRQLPWWWDKLSDVYEVLGRYDDARDALKKGGGLAEKGGSNVSQTINLAHFEVSAGRYDDALATLAAFDKGQHNVSPYGHMALREARACAHALKGDLKAAQADIDYMRAQRADAPSALGNALECMGDLDAAAAALIARLDDPDRRAAALVSLSDFDDPPVKRQETPLSRIGKQIKVRPDVQAAIQRAGGTRRFNIQSL